MDSFLKFFISFNIFYIIFFEHYHRYHYHYLLLLYMSLLLSVLSKHGEFIYHGEFIQT